MPYTYLIGWSSLNLWYYGVRYSSNACPSDLWKSYFTSSKHVKEITDLHGNPDVISIRKIFENSNQARFWETKVLRRLKVRTSPKWLNKTDNISFSLESSLKGAKTKKPGNGIGKKMPLGHSKGSSNPMFGRKRPDISNYNKTRISPFLGKTRPDHSELMKTNNPMKGNKTLFWNNGIKTIRALECPGPEWFRGRHKT